MKEQVIRKRNYAALLAEGSFFTVGMSFIDVNAVIPVFIFAYTRSVLLAGLAASINFAASIIMQTLVGPYVKGIRNMPRYISLIMFLFRPLPFVMIPVLLLDLNPWLTAGIFLVIYALLCGGDGLIVVPWTDLFSRTVVSERRGLLLGSQMLWGGIGALGAGYLIKWTLDNPVLGNDQRFALIFGGAGAALTLSALAMSFSRDLPRAVEQERPNHRYYYRQMPAYIRSNPLFTKVAVTRILSFVTHMVAPFVILFGQDLLQLQPEDMSTLIYIQIAGSLLGGMIWGRVSSKLGNHRVILFSQLLGLLLSVAVVVLLIASGPGLPAWLLWPIVLANGINMAAWLGFMNYTIDIVSDEDRTVYLLISNLMTFPFTFLTFLSGFLIQTWGYLPVFLISAAAASLAVIRAARMAPPPGPQEGLPVSILPQKE